MAIDKDGHWAMGWSFGSTIASAQENWVRAVKSPGCFDVTTWPLAEAWPFEGLFGLSKSLYPEA
jgi:hypothetical protein